MKLLRYGEPNQEKPGILDDNSNIRDMSSLVDDWSGDNLSLETLARVRSSDLSKQPIIESSVRIGPCLGRVGKFVCIGLNFSDHAAESGMKIPDEPVIFMKATSSISGPNDDIVMPRNSEKTDWEVELGITIGQDGKNISEDQAMNHVCGYFVVNDLSERSFQLEREGQWVKGKSCDTYGPIGPWLVTKDEIQDHDNLDMWLKVNDTMYQNGNSRTMIYKIPFIVSYLSRFMSLQAGDIISTGTPPGVGLGHNPPVYLKEGDKVMLGIEGLGVQKQKVVRE